MTRLPRRVALGKGYYILVHLANSKEIMDALDEDTLTADGVWFNELGENSKNKKGEVLAGRILIHRKLSSPKKWDTYWHELLHAVNDLMAYDRDHPLIV